MLKNHEFVNAVQGMVNKGLEQGIVHLYTDDERVDPGYLPLAGEQIANFGSCSYLGLEHDERLKQGAVDAIMRYGTQFSSSRAYVSTGAYGLFEEQLREIFQAHPVVAPTTSLGHIATLPTIVGDNDVVLLDHQVHSSVQTAAKILKSRGITVELIRHNRPDLIEQKILEYQSRCNHIWYLADGIYSMYGDGAPVAELTRLMNKYEQFYCYVDDAHGMSCFGRNGAGYVLDHGPLHPKMVLAVSFAKAFATGGSAIVFPNQEWAHTVRSCGGPMITSGPLQPATLGAAIASAQIHLSQEIYSLQEDLHDKIRFTEFLLQKAGLPLIKDNLSPVFFIGTSAPDAAFKVVGNMMKDGYYLNVSAFPVVPMKNAGIRFTITRSNEFDQIEQMVAHLKDHFHNVIEEENISLNKIYQAFKKTPPALPETPTRVSEPAKNNGISLHHHRSVQELNRAEWDGLFAGKGNYDAAALEMMEKAFTRQGLPECHWDMDYLIIRDSSNTPVLATFFTSTLVKDDMLADETQSEILETLRRGGDKYYMTSRVTMMGSLITEGDHLYLNEHHPLREEALGAMMKFLETLQKERKSDSIMLRDFDANSHMNPESVATRYDYMRKELPLNYSLDLTLWNDFEGYLNHLGYKSRRHIRRNVLPLLDQFEVRTDKTLMDPEVWYKLYLNVQENGRTLNTYPLPVEFFKEMQNTVGWDVLELVDKQSGKAVCAVYSYLTGGVCHTMLIGQDYDYNPYRPGMIETIKRAKELGCTTVQLGYSADMEKIRLGCTGKPKFALIQTQDTFAYEYISMLDTKKKGNMA
ncbi:MAG: GNAT family N-acetyltransferase [Bacteroidetes bacterium]|nr:GNAT family N-acetyltransferase [Bacteroidota bacterium]